MIHHSGICSVRNSPPARNRNPFESHLCDVARQKAQRHLKSWRDVPVDSARVVEAEDTAAALELAKRHSQGLADLVQAQVVEKDLEPALLEKLCDELFTQFDEDDRRICEWAGCGGGGIGSGYAAGFGELFARTAFPEERNPKPTSKLEAPEPTKAPDTEVLSKGLFGGEYYAGLGNWSEEKCERLLEEAAAPWRAEQWVRREIGLN